MGLVWHFRDRGHNILGGVQRNCRGAAQLPGCSATAGVQRNCRGVANDVSGQLGAVDYPLARGGCLG